MIEILASLGHSYFEFFTGDFVVFGILGTLAYIKLSKEEDDFYG